MKPALVLAPLCIAATAHAQAPGEIDVSPPGMTPVEPAAPQVERARRWSVGLGFGTMGLAPHHAPEVESEFGVGQLAVRYLATRHLEIELALSGGREKVDGHEGDREMSSGVLALRYRFSPGRKWNWWLMGGMGGLSVTHHTASEEEREASQQSTLQFGAGLERRWQRFAIQVEMRAVGVAPTEEYQAMGDTKPVAEPGQRPGGGGMEPPPGYYPAATGDGWAGGQFTISGNYYF